MTETKIYNALIEKYNNFEFRYIINNNGKKLFLLSDLTKYFQFTNNLSFNVLIEQYGCLSTDKLTISSKTGTRPMVVVDLYEFGEVFGTVYAKRGLRESFSDYNNMLNTVL